MFRGSLSVITFLSAFVFVVGASAPLDSQDVILGIEVSEVSNGGTVMGTPGSVLRLEVMSFVDTERECLQSVHLNLSGVGPVQGFAADGFDQAAAQNLIGHPLRLFSLTPRNGLCITQVRCVPGLVSYGAILETGAGVKEILDPGKTEILKLRLDVLVPEDPAGELVVLQFEEFLQLDDLSPRPQRNHVSCNGVALAPDWNAYSFRVLPFQNDPAERERFRRGDCNADGTVDVTDPVANLGFQFLGSFDPPCLDALDFNDSGIIDVTDPIASLTHQFIGGPPPAAPGKANCGVDPTDDEIGCDTFAQCP